MPEKIGVIKKPSDLRIFGFTKGLPHLGLTPSGPRVRLQASGPIVGKLHIEEGALPARLGSCKKICSFKKLS